MDLNSRYVVVSRLTGRVHWHGDPERLREQVHDATDRERMQEHVDRFNREAPGAYRLQAVGRSDFKTQLLQVALRLMHGTSGDALACMFSDAS